MDIANIDNARKIMTRIAEIDVEIIKLREFQTTAKKSNDNITDKIWSDEIKKLKFEKDLLRDQMQYAELRTFVHVTKSILSKQQYEEAWALVGKILLNPTHYFQDKKQT